MILDGLPYISFPSLEVANEFEQRLCSVTLDAGIIFVGVQAVPIASGVCTAFNITVGADRKFDERTIEAVVQKVFQKELSGGELAITVKVVRGSRGAACNKALQRPSSSPA